MSGSLIYREEPTSISKAKADIRRVLEQEAPGDPALQREAILEALRDLMPGGARVWHSAKRALLEWGAFYLHTLGGRKSDEHLSDVVDEVLRAHTGDPSFSSYFNSEGFDRARAYIEIVVFVAALWGQSGFPLVAPSHKLAAALMATDVPPDLAEVPLPWPSFAVLVPDGLIPAEAPDWILTPAALHLIGIAATGRGLEGDYFFWVAAKNRALVAGKFYRSVSQGLVEFPKFLSRQFRGEAECWQLACRLLAGVLVELDTPHVRERIAIGTPLRPRMKKRDRKGPPTCWTFELKRDVKVDCREWVRDYVRTGGRSIGVRRLVRGHQKRQPYGPGNSLRKWIHVEPYWQGNETDPIAVRAHRLDKANE